MTDAGKELHQIFVADHRDMTRGFRELLRVVRAGDDEQAVEMADAIDRQSGPHIAFEERYLYPLVGRQRGQEYASQLYHEHGEMLASLRTLQSFSAEGRKRLSDAQRQQLTAQLETGLQHAATCGTLLSHLQMLPAAEQRELLEAMREIRQQPCRWTELGSSRRATG